jgi:hypothetical protein
MPIGKDSITKRVAKIDATEKEPIIESVETPPPAVKATVKKSPAKKATTTKSVITNIAPETVEAVIGHKENKDISKVEIGTDLPYFLL